MESDDRLQYSYNRILDITAAIGIPIKLLSMYLIIFKSPRSMRHTSYFILNERLLLRNLVIMTTVPIVQGGLPLLGAIFFIYNSELPYAKVIVTGCIMMILNYGTVYGILMILIMHPSLYFLLLHVAVISACPIVEIDEQDGDVLLRLPRRCSMLHR
ncbi:hypothetical protein QR680_010196 [Steinernema hermaphroditum]|uniref:Uncharacterized protein n=1 Tax=Steinernema hermaphroditum TaxID=289476 RepID=A0AA39IN39_9BILA|nr:hypothetical protein QR680_010196 [Steinernema hermaphroditum]